MRRRELRLRRSTPRRTKKANIGKQKRQNIGSTPHKHQPRTGIQQEIPASVRGIPPRVYQSRAQQMCQRRAIQRLRQYYRVHRLHLTRGHRYAQRDKRLQKHDDIHLRPRRIVRRKQPLYAWCRYEFCAERTVRDTVYRVAFGQQRPTTQTPQHSVARIYLPQHYELPIDREPHIQRRVEYLPMRGNRTYVIKSLT